MADVPQCIELYYHKIFAHLLFQLKDIAVEQQIKKLVALSGQMVCLHKIC